VGSLAKYRDPSYYLKRDARARHVGSRTFIVVFDKYNVVQYRSDSGLSLSLMYQSGIAPIVRGEVIE